VRKALRLFAVGVVVLVLTTVAQGLWTAQLVANLRTTPAVPWSVVTMAVLLWILWQYAGGRWWPEKTAGARRLFLRANRVDSRVLAMALLAGSCSLVALTGIWIVLFQTGLMRGNPLPDFSLYPVLTTAAVLVMASLVGAFIEEAGFRGYLQVALEREYPAPLAIALAAVALAPGHGLTQGFAWPTIVFYFMVDVMLGVTAYLCRSVWPGVAVHAAGLLIFFAIVWPFDSQRPLLANGTMDWWFWLHVAQATLFAVLAVLAFRRLARLAARRDGALVIQQPA
jgi:membrane protease YdiL (CAAX protease family)